jgi:hypothetical protein
MSLNVMALDWEFNAPHSYHFSQNEDLGVDARFDEEERRQGRLRGGSRQSRSPVVRVESSGYQRGSIKSRKVQSH